MTSLKENGAVQGPVIIQLWQADKIDYSDLAANEQRFFRRLQQAIEIHDINPSLRTQADTLIAQRRWMASFDQLRLSAVGGEV